MKKLLFLALVSISTLAADSDKLGVLYDPSANNTVSPTTLRIGNFSVLTNFTLANGTPARVLVLNSSTNATSSDLTSDQANNLALMVGNSSLLYLGTNSISAGAAVPTNGVAGIQNGSIYINRNGANANSLIFFSYDTNWYSLASTNGGAITEAQLNFSDNTTANATTNAHGLLPKLDGNGLLFLSGAGTWTDPLNPIGALTAGTYPIYQGVGNSLTDGRIRNTSTGGVEIEGTRVFGSYALTITNFSWFKGTDNWFNTATITNFGGGTIGDVSITAHGLVPTAPNDSSKFLNGLGQWAVPSGSGGGIGTTGSPAATELAYFTGTNTVSGVPSSSVSVAGVSIPSITASTSLTIPAEAASGNVLAGRYTPTVTGYSGFSTTIGTTQVPCNYVRIGNTIMVSGKVQITKETSRYLRFYVSLPVTGISSVNYLNGTWSIQEGSSGLEGGTAGYICTFYMDTGSTSGGLRTAHFNFTYNLSY
jgi:hypothetical protein